jgi:hypothetical protein
MSFKRDKFEDFSVPHCYWLLGFERFNGYLRSFVTIGRNIELTFMKRYMERFSLKSNILNALSLIKSKCSTSFAASYQADFERVLNDVLLKADLSTVHTKSNKKRFRRY